MEKKLIALVLAGLMGGLAGGYGLNYVIYRPQIQNLQKSIDKIQPQVQGFQENINEIQQNLNRSWHRVYYIDADSDINARIQLEGSSVRVMWIAYGASDNAELSIWLGFINGTPFAVWGSSGGFTANNAVLELQESGSYDLTILPISTYYVVSVWDYY